jgi:proteasome lid subunit RPN8/RPN11
MNETVSKLLKLYTKEYEFERCGLIVGDEIIEADNIHPDPSRGFIIPSEFMIAHEDTATATWHTHPNEPSNLSHEDYEGFSQWPSLTHYIIGIDGVRAFRLRGNLIVEVSLD